MTSVTFRNAQGATTKYITYEYDGLDRRIRRKEQNYDPPGTPGPVVSQVRYLYDTDLLQSPLPRIGGEGQGEGADNGFWEVALVIDELTAYSGPSGGATMPGEIAHRFLNGPMVDQVFADGTAVGDILWYVFDHQNTVRDVAVFDGTPGDQAEVVNHLTYDSFGNVVDADDPTTGTASDGDLPGTTGQHAPQRGYTGREPDASTGLIYYRARWYDPALGRFISEDPIGFAAGDTNLSRYVGNSTPNATDPSGLEKRSARERLIEAGVSPSSIVEADRQGALIAGPIGSGLGYWSHLVFGSTNKYDSAAESCLKRGYYVIRPGGRILYPIGVPRLSSAEPSPTTPVTGMTQVEQQMAEEGILGSDVTNVAANQKSAGNDGKSVGESAGDVGPAIEGLAGTVATDVTVSAGAGPALGLVGKLLEKTGLAKLGAKVGGRIVAYAKGKLDDAWAAVRRRFSQCDAPNKLPWDSWHNLPKVVENGTEYAKIGDRLYTGHAVDRMLPSGLGRPAGGAGAGRSISPTFVEDVIQHGTQTHVVVDGVPRTIHTSGTVQVVTEQGGRIVVTINPFSGG